MDEPLNPTLAKIARNIRRGGRSDRPRSGVNLHEADLIDNGVLGRKRDVREAALNDESGEVGGIGGTEVNLTTELTKKYLFLMGAAGVIAVYLVLKNR